MTDLIDNIIEDKQAVKNQLGSVPDIITVLKKYGHKIRVRNLVTKFVSYPILSSFIIGHPTQAQRDYTLLETSYGEQSIVYVVPNNNIFEEWFTQDEYIDTKNSTGTLDTTNFTYTVNSSEVLETDIIFKTNKNIEKIKTLELTPGIQYTPGFILNVSQLNVDPIGGGTIKTEISNDGGQTWELVNNIYNGHTFSNLSNDGLKIRFIGNATFTFEAPMKFKIYEDGQ